MWSRKLGFMGGGGTSKLIRLDDFYEKKQKGNMHMDIDVEKKNGTK